MQAFDQQVANELNILRTSPQQYASKVRQYINYFKGTVLRIPGSNIGIQTKEGAKAYEEAGEYLEKHKGIHPLKLNYVLCKLANDFLKEIQKTPFEEINNIDLELLMSNYGKFDGSYSRSIDFGATNPEMVIINLLVGDGDETKSQRQNMFNEKLYEIGVASGKYEEPFDHITVILTCTKFISNNPEDENMVFQAEEKKVSLNKEPTKLKSRAPNKPTMQNQNLDNFEDPECPQGVKRIVKTEREVVEGGKRKKVIKTVKYMEDGSVHTEIEKEVLE